jgi:hypothetical protein
MTDENGRSPLLLSEKNLQRGVIVPFYFSFLPKDFG